MGQLEKILRINIFKVEGTFFCYLKLQMEIAKELINWLIDGMYVFQKCL